MNRHFYRLVFNRRRGVLEAVPEYASGSGRLPSAGGVRLSGVLKGM